MKIVWSPLAMDRVTEIAAYIAQDNRSASIKWVTTLFDKVQMAASSPRSGRIVPEIQKEAIREVIYGNYRIIYRVEKNRISLLTVRHGRQILPKDEVDL
jgi:plasmid stabilization system protein ParE